LKRLSSWKFCSRHDCSELFYAKELCRKHWTLQARGIRLPIEEPDGLLTEGDETACDGGISPAEDKIDRARLLGAVYRTLTSKRERIVIVNRFGLTGRGTFSLQKIASALQVDRERIRQIEERALKRLRNRLNVMRVAPWAHR